MVSGRAYATLLNLSSAGAQLAGDRLPGAGKDVLLTCNAIEIFGTVLWESDGRCGVAFDEPIGPKVVGELRRTAGEAARSLVDQDEIQAAADWASGLAR